ncbi:hypothetical protein IAT38_007465 [Cryptococcus sp. DSM 104549]
MAPIKVAAVQAPSVAFDLTASVQKLQQLVQEAKAGGADFVQFPEAYLGGYPRYLGFHVGARTAENREWYSRYVQASVMIPEDAEGKDWLSSATVGDDEALPTGNKFWAFSQLCQAARSNKVLLSVGIIERSIIGATLWCTNVLFGPDGRLLAKHRKLQPTAAERIIWSQGDAVNREGPGTDNLPVVETEIGRIGGLICWENLMPLARYALYQKGVEIYTAPTADGRTTWMPSMQHIAQEGRCFVVSANQYHTSDDFPSDYPVAHGVEKGIWCRGGSCIIGPLGEVLAGPLWDKEGIIYADIDLSTLHGYKLDFDPVGHYSRIEVFKDLIK